MCFHSYADDAQICLQLKSINSTMLKSLFQCLDEVKTWMASNVLNFNEEKTEVIIFGPSCNSSTPDLDLRSLVLFVKYHLGVILYNKLTFEKQINSVFF